MNFIKRLLEKINGLHYRQEYLCLALEDFNLSPAVFIVADDRIVKKLNDEIIFVGYSPVIFALPVTLALPGRLNLVFSRSPLNENEKISKKDVLASLILEQTKEIFIGKDGIRFYKVLQGRHQFLPGYHQWAIGLHNSWFNRKKGNVFLPGNLIRQVQIAYAVPRKICLITVASGGLYNLFPTDLHGKLGEQWYVVSLRYEGRACQQVMESRRILLSSIEASAYKSVYALGKNHMQPLRERGTFGFSHQDSEVLHLPLPESANAYKELELLDSFQEGIHRLLIFRIIKEVQISDHPATLGHIHTAYASWLENRGLRGNYLLR